MTDKNRSAYPDSPCIGVCSTLYDDICKGCGRTAQEVAQWVFLSHADKIAVWQRLEQQGIAQQIIAYQRRIGIKK